MRPPPCCLTVNDLVNRVEDVQNGASDDIHVSSLKFHHNATLDQEAVPSHVVPSETRMIVHRLVNIFKADDRFLVHVR